jgi:hypothetical protein
VITGDRTSGAAMIDHKIPQMVSITGSVRAGMEVAKAASSDLKRVHLELGGKAPVVVFDDADIASAVEGIATRVFQRRPRLHRCHSGLVQKASTTSLLPTQEMGGSERSDRNAQ